MKYGRVTADLAELLRQHGVQVTAQRLAVLRSVSTRPHGTTEDIAEVVRSEIGAISRQAVYDALGVLVDKGLIRRIQPVGSPARYEDRVGDNHHHLICRICGHVLDVDCGPGNLTFVLAEAGFTVQVLEPYGALVELAGKNAEGFRAVSLTLPPTSDDPAVVEYREAMKKYAPKQKPDFYSIANFAWANRQVIGQRVREAFERFFGSAGGLRLVYDVAHNMAKLEEHGGELLVVHRKGATRAFGAVTTKFAVRNVPGFSGSAGGASVSLLHAPCTACWLAAKLICRGHRPLPRAACIATLRSRL